MQMKHVEAAATLVKALSDLDGVTSEAHNRHTAPHFCLNIGVYEADGDDGGTTHAWAHLPLEMCEPVVAILRQLVIGQLKALGVEIPEQTGET